jgi:phospholipase C
MPAALEHVFVLMLENRSFDHLFGFSGLSGIDATTGAPTAVEGLRGNESNALAGNSYQVVRGADYAMPADPGHEFPDVLGQLCGTGVRYEPPYPTIDNSGFVDSYNDSGGSSNPVEVMKCFDTPRQLPVLYALAREFAICDHWFSSMPGPTWPNRMFVHAASSGGLEHSPTTAEIVEWEALNGFTFKNGTIFEAMTRRRKAYHFYSGDDFPMVAALKGVTLLDVHRIGDLLTDLEKNPFPYDYVFIEPSYNALHDFQNSSSQHPLSDVRAGEALVKTVYEGLRASPIWENSLFIVTWDEHGGFYDHMAPPRAVAPGDTTATCKYNRSGFTFEQYGVRTPAIVVSPWIPRGTIDHRIYDHASVPATLEAVFQLQPLTARDASARSLMPLLSLPTPREQGEALATLPMPCTDAAPLVAAAAPNTMAPLGDRSVAVTRPDDPITGDAGMLPAIVHAALRQDLQLEPEHKAEILDKVSHLQTRADAMRYLMEVQAKLRTGTQRPSTAGERPT